jgi:hypothetical protein
MRGRPINLREGGPGETLVDVAAVGMCGRDLHYYKDGGIGSAIIHEHSFQARLERWLAQRANDFAVGGLRECPQLRTHEPTPPSCKT